MSISRLIFNILLALALALPLAAVETGYSFPKVDTTPPKPVEMKLPQPTALGLGNEYPDLVEIVGEKVSKPHHEFANEHKFDTYIQEAAKETGISPALIKAVMRAESNFHPKVVSPMGAVGLMQVLPSTARRLGVRNPHDPKANVLAGARFLKLLLEMFDDNEALALAAYNSGPARVKRYGGVPPIRETRAFVDQVMYFYFTYLES